jgi:hypothetical protein
MCVKQLETPSREDRSRTSLGIATAHTENREQPVVIVGMSSPLALGDNAN